MSMRGALEVVRRVRAEVDTPIVLFTYANPVVRMDATVFARTAAEAGVDGVLVLDYPVEEAEPLRAPLRDAGLDPIFLISPTTSEERIRKSAALGSGFLYVISRLGVTGVRDKLPEDVGRLMARVRACADLPVALGFGIAHPDQVAEACRVADAAVVGSALVNVVAERTASSNECEHASEYVRWLKNGL
jgi:tryptophan synthase alpha chain